MSVATVLPQPQRQASVELYRRRRFATLIALTVAVLILSQLAGLSLMGLGTGSGATTAASDATSAVHIVRPGDTYAAVAAVFGADNPNLAASQLQAANGGSELVVGQRLVFDLGVLGSAAG